MHHKKYRERKETLAFLGAEVTRASWSCENEASNIDHLATAAADGGVANLAAAGRALAQPADYLEGRRRRSCWLFYQIIVAVIVVVVVVIIVLDSAH